jgi:hypothetical protein
MKFSLTKYHHKETARECSAKEENLMLFESLLGFLAPMIFAAAALVPFWLPGVCN